MSRFADGPTTDPMITLPRGAHGKHLREGLLRAADTVIIKVRDSRAKRQGKNLCLGSIVLMGLLATLSAVIVALVVLILKV